MIANGKKSRKKQHTKRSSILLFLLLLILASILVWHLFIPVTIIAAIEIIHFGVLTGSLIGIAIAMLLIFLLSGAGFLVIAVLTFVGVLVGIIIFPFLFPFIMLFLIMMAVVGFFRR